MGVPPPGASRFTRSERDNSVLRDLLKVKTSPTDTFGGQTAVRWAGRSGLFAQRGVFNSQNICLSYGFYIGIGHIIGRYDHTRPYILARFLTDCGTFCGNLLVAVHRG